ncbi:helix-turn-helix domain-containing protein [Lysinibacillus xylanilyticus]|uniref:helix-turn-helix domain-containing protein n=1 Tax=Lysinibacillus xylanilyticus TaxID=582475 RepID=UPI002B24DCB5|nr:helix-turn-helix transcriptional regulator [Lysinibacillus xylanilyticus]MEB2300240.1 helix-turn-helix domain-containing protein [Lysinibacillus xylanilyticus]
MNRGKTLKQIRKNKGLSQLILSKGIVSQSTYSKYEAGSVDVDAEKYIKLLNKLNISLEEFEYIHNDRIYRKKKDIIQQFFMLNHNDIEKLTLLKLKTAEYLQIENDLEIKEIRLVCEALIQLNQENINEAKEIIKPIWERISKYDQWYLSDICLINTILFLFPVDIAIEFTQNVLKRLNKYNSFRDIALLKSAFNINLSLLVITNEDYSTALSIINDSLRQYKSKMNYHILALHFSRKAICHFHLGYNDSTIFLEKAFQLIRLYEDDEYFERIQLEFFKYTTIHDQELK